jgi:hypothetical protein
MRGVDDPFSKAVAGRFGLSGSFGSNGDIADFETVMGFACCTVADWSSSMRPSSSESVLTDRRLSFSGICRSVLISSVFRLDRLVDTDAVSEAMSASPSAVPTFISASTSSTASRLATMDGAATVVGLVGEPCVENFETGIRICGDLGVSGVDSSAGTSGSLLMSSLSGVASAGASTGSTSADLGGKEAAENLDIGRAETAGTLSVDAVGVGSARGSLLL